MSMLDSMKSSERLERCRRYGFDCADSLEWRGWEPGGEYTMRLSLQNVGKKMQTIKYKLPTTKFFGMEFPTVVKVSPGMSYDVDVVFRPIVAEEYDDCVEFTTVFGVFSIPVRATLLKKSFSAPDSFEFGFCPTMEISEGAFEVINDGELPLTFDWHTEEPFSVSPASATLEPGTSCPVTASFYPQAGTVFVSTAVCRVDGLEPREMKLTGVGKFTYLSASDTELDFGDVQTGNTSTRTITLRNQSLVNASFKIVNLDTNEGDIFAFSPTVGVIPPEETVDITIKFGPHCTGMYSSENFEVATPGGNTIQINCAGLSVGPDIHLSTHSMNFGDVVSGQSSSKSVRISNSSTMGADFQVLSEKDGVFKFERVEGIVPAELYPGKAGHIDVVISFSPEVPANYYKRVYILFKNQSPSYIDVFGTCYDTKIRPAPFSQRHIDAYRAREAAGDGCVAPDKLEEMDYAHNLALEATQDIDLSEDDLWSEIFREYDDTSRPVCVKETFVDFGSCSITKMSEKKTITVVNGADAKVQCKWVLPNQWVKIFPESADVPAGGATTFQVAFRPGAENMYYGCTLEAFVSFKTMRNFRLVTDKSFVPPWHLEVEVQGHTFAPGAEHFLPKVGLPGGGDTVFFPAAPVPGSRYQTLALTNNAHTPLFFKMDTGLTNFAFSCKPMRGLVQSNSRQMVALRFKPTVAKVYTSALKAIFNTTPLHTIQFPVSGTGFLPSLKMYNDATLFFKPTCVGTTSILEYPVTNPSRMSIAYDWHIPPSVQQYFTIEPREGVIRGNETHELSCVFNPKKRKKYHFKVACNLRPPGTDGSPLKAWLTVIGQGEVGAVTLVPEVVDFQTVIIGGSEKRTLRMHNRSECPMHWNLDVAPTGETATAAQTEAYAVTLAKAEAFEFQVTSGVLVAGSLRDIPIVMRPTVTGRHDYSMTCRYSLQSEDGSTDNIQLPVAQIIACAAYPYLAVTDLWCHGSEAVTAKRVQWDQLNCDTLNHELGSDLSEAEIASNDPEGPLLDMQAYIASLVAVPLVFVSREQGCSPCHMTLQFENVGDLPLSWHIKYPDDIGIEPEHWAEKESATEEMVKQGFMLDNEIFQVYPRGGDLLPGERENVELVYQYKDVSYGHHHLNVILQIHNGKQVVLRLSGTTLKTQEKCILTNGDLKLTPAPIGLTAAPVQTMEVHNIGEDELKFHLDLSHVEELCRQNYSFPVLTCHDPAGTIDPGKSALVRWSFNPIEDKVYKVQAALAIVDGPSYDLSIEGRGYHPDIATKESLMHPSGTFPAQPTMLAAGQLAVLSHDSVEFGMVPSHAISRRIIVVHNVVDHPIRFEWDMRHPRFTKVFDVSPSAGSLQPNECCVCRFRMKAGLPETYKFDASVRVFDEVEEANYEATLRELQRLSEEAADDDAVGDGDTAPKRSRRKRNKKRVSVVATSTLPRQRKVLFGKSTTLSASSNLGGTSTKSLGTARSMMSMQSGRGSVADSLAGSAVSAARSARTGTFAGTAVTFEDGMGEDTGPPPPPLPYVAWTSVSANVVAVSDLSGQPKSEFVLKKGLKGAETIMNETGGLNMPLIEGAMNAHEEDAAAPDMAVMATNSDAVATAEQALTVLLADITQDPGVADALASIATERTPYYAALTQRGGRLRRPESAASDRPNSPQAEPLSAPQAVSPTPEAAQSATKAPAAAAAAAAAVTEANDGSLPETGGETEAESVAAAPEPDDAGAAARPSLGPARKRGLLADPFVESLFESVLEDTFFNMMAEVVHGEFNLDLPPRQIIQNVSVSQGAS